MDIASVNEALKDVRAAMRADGGDVEVVKVEGDKIFVIEEAKCTECKEEGGPKCIPVCPVDCIVKAG